MVVDDDAGTVVVVDDVVGRVDGAGCVRVGALVPVVLVDRVDGAGGVVVDVDPSAGAVDSGVTGARSGTVVLVGADGTEAAAGPAPMLGSGRTSR